MIVRTACLITAAFLFKFSVAQQSVKSYVLDNFSVVESITNDTNYNGYEAIAKAIGDRRVVMMGEQDHGDAASFLAKTKLIKYLHEKKGFNVIAFESDFFALTEGQKSITDNKESLKNYFRGNIFPIWTYCNGCKELFYEFLPATMNTDKPMILTGFDNQLHGTYSRKNIVHFLDSSLSDIKLDVADGDSVKSKVFKHVELLMSNYGKNATDKNLYDSASKWLQLLITAYEQQKGNDYTWQLLKSIDGFNNQSILNGGEYNEVNDARDVQMADNLDWVVNHLYKNEKIIIWAANGHIMKNSKLLMKHYFTTMGTHYSNMTGNEAQTYIIGFTSNYGTTRRLAGSAKSYDLRKPDKDGFENFFKDRAYTFTDLINYGINNPNPEAFKLKGINHMWDGKLTWSKGYDGIFYIREMLPCEQID